VAIQDFDTWREWGTTGAVLEPVTPEGVAIHYPGPGSFVFASHDQCRRQARAWDVQHRQRGSRMLEYGALLCHHLIVIEGRNRRGTMLRRVGSNGTTDANLRALSIQLMRGTDDPNPTDDELAALGEWVALARDEGCGPDVTGHRDWYATACPGEPLYRALPTIRKYANGEGGDVPLDKADLKAIAAAVWEHKLQIGEVVADGIPAPVRRPAGAVLAQARNFAREGAKAANPTLTPAQLDDIADKVIGSIDVEVVRR
jgi:hypothetical protein